jgi:hypothetical protein
VNDKRECRYVVVAGTVLVVQGDKLPHTARHTKLFQLANAILIKEKDEY